MSFDLSVVTSRLPDIDNVREFLRERRSNSTVEGQFEQRKGHAVVYVPKRSEQHPIFMLDGPFEIEAEDVQEAIADVVLAPRWLLEINVPLASSAGDLKLAKALATHLAKEFDGAAYDPQDDLILWPKRRKKRFRSSREPETINVISLRWILPYSRRERTTAEAFLRATRMHCSECLPRRFGLFEPFQGRATDGDYRAFLDLWDEALAEPNGGDLFFSSTAPCFGGYVSFSDPRDGMPWGKGGQKIVDMGLDFDGRAFEEEIWCAAVENLFVHLARDARAFYAIGYLVRGAEARGNRLWSGADTETYPLPRTDRWIGIPPVPTWMTWFGPPYAAKVRLSCEDHIAADYPEGFLLKLSKKPRDIDTLEASFRGFPKELEAKLSEQTLSRQLASIFPPKVRPDDPRMNDGPADVILPVE